jgi:hypothetical protein
MEFSKIYFKSLQSLFKKISFNLTESELKATSLDVWKLDDIEMLKYSEHMFMELNLTREFSIEVMNFKIKTEITLRLNKF